MSMVMNFAPFVEMMLLSRSLTVSMPAVGVPQSPVKLILLPPTVSLILLGSSFSGLKLATIRPYVTSLHLFCGMWDLSMKVIVLVPSTSPGMHCANLPFPFRRPYSMSRDTWGWRANAYIP